MLMKLSLRKYFWEGHCPQYSEVFNTPLDSNSGFWSSLGPRNINESPEWASPVFLILLLDTLKSAPGSVSIGKGENSVTKRINPCREIAPQQKSKSGELCVTSHRVRCMVPGPAEGDLLFWFAGRWRRGGGGGFFLYITSQDVRGVSMVPEGHPVCYWTLDRRLDTIIILIRVLDLRTNH